LDGWIKTGRNNYNKTNSSEERTTLSAIISSLKRHTHTHLEIFEREQETKEVITKWETDS
jgi:hypothetical protein